MCSSKAMSTVEHLAALARRQALAGDGDEEVEQAVGAVARAVDEHEAAGARAR